jgi:hypothetical protein
MARTMSSASFLVEDITATDPPSCPIAVNGAFNDIQTNAYNASQPPVR